MGQAELTSGEACVEQHQQIVSANVAGVATCAEDLGVGLGKRLSEEYDRRGAEEAVPKRRRVDPWPTITEVENMAARPAAEIRGEIHANRALGAGVVATLGGLSPLAAMRPRSLELPVADASADFDGSGGHPTSRSLGDVGRLNLDSARTTTTTTTTTSSKRSSLDSDEELNYDDEEEEEEERDEERKGGEVAKKRGGRG